MDHLETVIYSRAFRKDSRTSEESSKLGTKVLVHHSGRFSTRSKAPHRRRRSSPTLAVGLLALVLVTFVYFTSDAWTQGERTLFPTQEGRGTSPSIISTDISLEAPTFVNSNSCFQV